MKSFLPVLVFATPLVALPLAACDDGSEEEEICCACRCTGTGPNLALCSKIENVPLGDHDDCRVACTHDGCDSVCIVLTGAEADCE